MVSSTDRPDILRVSFVDWETPKQRTEIVCTVEADSYGELKIVYHHHTEQSRPTAKGSWEPASTIRHQSLTPAMESSIRTHVMYQLFSVFAGAGSVSLSDTPMYMPAAGRA
jgi:hypothetical protein